MNPQQTHSPGQSFWHGRNVLITGPLGFLGKLIVEKLLRCFPEVSALFLFSLAGN
jgi:FlaA1/EpsC-like NDP-sugar epimerase